LPRYKRKPPKGQACKGKKKYRKLDAKNIAFNRERQTGGLYKAYRCQYGCKLENGEIAWHIGHRYDRRGW